MNDAVCIRDLSKFTLRSLDLTVGSAERVAVIGRTGEGKSVLLKCVTGLLRPDSGTIDVLGQRLTGSVMAIPGAGVAFQNSGLFENVSIRSNIELAAGRRLSDEELGSWLNALDLSSLDPHGSVAGLSGGQVKRLALLRAIVFGQRLIILDEPTSGLDPATAGRVADVLSATLSKDDRAVLLVTHDYETAARLCGRFYLLTAAGSLDEIAVPSSMQLAEKVGLLRDALATRNEGAVRIERRPVASASLLALITGLLSDSVPIALAAMALLGALLVMQSSGISPIDISRHVPGIVVWAIFREVAPLVVGLLLAGRVAARIASEVGGMSYSAQIASMRVYGLSPARRLLLPFLVSSAIVFPICITGGACAAILAGAGFAASPWSHLSIGADRFISLAADAFTPLLFASCIMKGILMAAVVTAWAYNIGVAPIDTAPAVGSAVTRSVVLGSISIVAIDIAMSLLLF